MDPKTLLPKTQIGAFKLRGLKLAGGDETPRFEATLLEDGKAVATVSNDGRGGQSDIQPLDASQRWRDTVDALTKRLDAAAQAMPPLDLGDGTSIPCDWDVLLLTLVENEETLRGMKRDARTKTLYHDPREKDPDYTHSVLKFPATDPRVKPWLQKHGCILLNDAVRDA